RPLTQKERAELDELWERLLRTPGALRAFLDGKKEAPQTEAQAPGVESCKSFLKEQLRDGARPTAEIERLWAERGGLPGTLKNARRRLGVIHFRIGGKKGQVMMALPGAKKSRPGTQKSQAV